MDWPELGLLTYLMSKPDGWNVSIKHLTKQKPSGETRVKSLLKKLQNAGYAEWTRFNSGEVEWTIYEEPQVDNPLEENDHISAKGENPHVENPQEANPQEDFHPDIVKTQPLVKTDKKVKTNRAKGKSTETWNAYSKAYLQRYDVAPPRGAKVNTLLCQLVDLLGTDQAPLVAAYYLQLNDRWYQQKSHDVPTLIQNAQAIFTQWARGTNQTSIDYRNQERSSNNQNVQQKVEQRILAGKL